MRKIYSAMLLILLITAPVWAEDSAKLFKTFNVTSGEDPKVTFNFSEGYASSESPIVISVVGRQTVEADRTYRTSLQRHWLSINVPSSYKLDLRVMSECKLVREGEFSVCDYYRFIDPISKKTFVYYIYIGNWP